MRLLTHNMLASNVKGVQNGYPLLIEAETLETREVEFNTEFLQHIYPKLDWRALLQATEALGLHGLPAEVQPEMLQSDTFLKALHHVLLEVHVEEGALVCPETGHRFVVRQGIPNMLLDEDKVAVK